MPFKLNSDQEKLIISGVNSVLDMIEDDNFFITMDFYTPTNKAYNIGLGIHKNEDNIVPDNSHLVSSVKDQAELNRLKCDYSVNYVMSFLKGYIDGKDMDDKISINEIQEYIKNLYIDIGIKNVLSSL